MSKKLYQLVPVYGDWGFTAEGGLYQTYINRTGSASVKGTIVVSSTAYDNAVAIAPASSQMSIGVIYEGGIANGSPVKVVISGKAQVLLQDTNDSFQGYWCGTSLTPGRMFQNATLPVLNEWQAIGHSMEDVTSGTNVLAWVTLQFN
jgi:hypothetical protein